MVYGMSTKQMMYVVAGVAAVGLGVGAGVFAFKKRKIIPPTPMPGPVVPTTQYRAASSAWNPAMSIWDEESADKMYQQAALRGY